MGLVLSSLTEYVEENVEQLNAKAITTGQALSMMPKYGVRGTGRMLNKLAPDVAMRLASCGFNDASTSEITQNELKVGHLMVDHSICMSDLQKYFTDLARNPSKGSYNDEAPFEGQIFLDFVEKVGQENSIALWKASIANGTGNYGLFDGIIEVLDGQAVIDGNTGSVTVSTGVDATNIIEIVDAMDDAFDEDSMSADDKVIFLPIAWYRLYIKAIRNANLYHHDADMGNLQYKIPATDTLLVGERGLKGTDEMYGFSLSNSAIGVAEGGDRDVENFTTDFEKKTDTLWMKIKYALGVQFFHYDEVVVFKLVP